MQRALSGTNDNWTVDTKDDGNELIVSFHRRTPDWKADFRLLKKEHYLVSSSQMTEDGNLLFDSKIEYRSLTDGSVIPDSWREQWYEAYLGPIDESTDEPTSNKIRRSRYTRVIEYEPRTELKCAEVNWRMMRLPNDILLARRTSEGSAVEMRIADDALIPSELLK